MRRLLAALVLLSLTVGVVNADLAPATVTYTNLRDTATIQYATAASYFEETTILATNCVVYAGANTNTPQNLTDITVTWTLGNTTTSTAYTGTVTTATSGVWSCEATVPAYSNMTEFYMQTTLTHTNGTSYTYEWLKARIKQAL